MITEKATEHQMDIITEQHTSYGLANAKQTDNSQSNSVNSRQPTAELVTDTPFILVADEGEYFIALAQYKLTPKRATKEEALTDIQSATWNTMLNIFDAMMNIREEANNLKKGENN